MDEKATGLAEVGGKKQVSAALPRVMHVSTAHPALDPRIFYRECRSLREAGFDVELIAIYDDARAVDGISIWPLPGGRSRLLRALHGSSSAFKYIMSRQPRLIHLHDPELLPLGFIFKLFGKKVIFDAHEELPQDILLKSWMPSWLRRAAAAVSRCALYFAGRTFDAIVTATPAIARDFSGARVAVVGNFPDANLFSAPSLGAYSQRPREIIYVGLVEQSRGFRSVFEALEDMEGNDRVKLRIVGAGEIPPEMQGLVNRPVSPDVVFSGKVPYPEIPHMLTSPRAGLLTLMPIPTYRTSLPLKLFEYMAAGLPVIASNFPYWQDLLRDVDCCIFVDPQKPAEIAEAVAQLLDDPARGWAMGQRGREAVEQRFNWREEAAKLVSVYKEVLGEREPAGGGEIPC